jgi:hypothetical protein
VVIAVGEIDLASLTEQWCKKLVQKMELEYLRARWPDGTPAEFEYTLATVRLYLQLRWLGAWLEWTTDESALRRFE